MLGSAGSAEGGDWVSACTEQLGLLYPAHLTNPDVHYCPQHSRAEGGNSYFFEADLMPYQRIVL